LSGTTIAAHAHHLAFGMADACRCLGGDRTPQDWRQSWRVARVDEEEWRRLQERLRSEYARLGAAVAAHAGSSQEALGDALGVLAHLAYHLGAIQQKRAALRELSGER
jgi:hypothetical protein